MAAAGSDYDFSSSEEEKSPLRDDILPDLHRFFEARYQQTAGPGVPHEILKFMKGTETMRRLKESYPLRFLYLVMNSERNFSKEDVDTALELIGRGGKLQLVQKFLNLDYLETEFQDEVSIMKILRSRVRMMTRSGFYVLASIVSEYSESVNATGYLREEIFKLILNQSLKEKYFINEQIVKNLIKNGLDIIIGINVLSKLQNPPDEIVDLFKELVIEDAEGGEFDFSELNYTKMSLKMFVNLITAVQQSGIIDDSWGFVVVTTLDGAISQAEDAETIEKIREFFRIFLEITGMIIAEAIDINDDELREIWLESFQ